MELRSVTISYAKGKAKEQVNVNAQSKMNWKN